jgi:C1A family cysteine protease
LDHSEEDFMARTINRFGWVPDIPDHRDHLYAAPLRRLGPLPKVVDLRKQCPPVYDQGELGSCTANAIGAAFEFELRKQNLAKDFMPSRLFIYYNERAMEHTIMSDAGAMIRDGIKSVKNQGVCSEKTWPYMPTKFKSKPPAPAYKEALAHQVVSYERLVPTVPQLKGCLASGFPFVFGFSVFDAFESDAVAKSGKLDLPGPKEKSLGGHAVLAVGYDDAKQRFIVRNSWGNGWGLKGYFTMPYAYLTDDNLSDDFWTIKVVEDA